MDVMCFGGVLKCSERSSRYEFHMYAFISAAGKT